MRQALVAYLMLSDLLAHLVPLVDSMLQQNFDYMQVFLEVLQLVPGGLPLPKYGLFGKQTVGTFGPSSMELLNNYYKDIDTLNKG